MSSEWVNSTKMLKLYSVAAGLRASFRKASVLNYFLVTTTISPPVQGLLYASCLTPLLPVVKALY